MSRIKALLREPLVQFLVIGAALFVTFDLRQGDSLETDKVIRVSSGQMEQFSAQFERTWLRPPTEVELSGLIEGYIRDEVYYREARAMGLDENDGIVRQRMRLKLEFILEDLSADTPPDDEQLAEFMQRHPDRFRIEPRISFTQVYLNPDTRPDITADATETLARLKGGAAPETEGDRLLVDQSLTLASPYRISNVFGASFAEQIVALEPNGWVGPVNSGFGAHLVNVTEKQAGRFPELSEIRDEVALDYMAERRQELKDRSYARLREAYEVIIEAADVSMGQSQE